MINAVAFQQEQQLRRLRQPTDRASWIVPPYAVNAFYLGLLNSISERRMRQTISPHDGPL